jgi:pimeloyl-[acyl-carrier protein] methyl ester esterase
MPFLDTGSGAIHYEELGSGPPLVLLHGWCMSSAVWRPLYPLADRCRLIMPDLPGHGRSPRSGEFTPESLAADLEALCRGLGLERPVLAGWSLGGMAALAAAPFLGERLAGLVLLGSTARFTTTAGYDCGRDPRELKGLEARIRRDYGGALAEFVTDMFRSGELPPLELAAVVAELASPASLPPVEVARAGLRFLATTDLRQLLASINSPSLVLHGEDDRVCPAAAGKFLTHGLPAARLVLLPETGHAPFLSRPCRVMELLADFLKEYA